MNEEQLIARLLEAAAGTSGGVPLPLLGPGDDAAVLRPPPGRDLVWTCDDQVEGVHFERRWCPWPSVARRALGSAASDLAAMGAEPLGVLLSLGVPRDFGPDDVGALGRGVGEKLSSLACPLVGGNVTRSPGGVHLSVSVLGSTHPGLALRRDAARSGDVLYVSGPLGLARAGLLWLQAGGPAGDPLVQAALQSFLDPRPRLALGQELSKLGRVACMDLSDGLARDLPRMLAASGVAATLHCLPAPPQGLADRLNERVGGARETAAALAWVGGEDYELLVAGPDGLPGLTPIGRVHAGDPGAVRLEGPLAALEGREGHDHIA